MKKLLLLLVLSSLICSCNKYTKDKKFESCQDSLNKNLVIPALRGNSKVILKYHFGMSSTDFKVISDKLWLSGLIDESNNYKFKYAGLKDVKFSMRPNYHNDSLKAINFYNSKDNRIGGNVDDIFTNLNAVLSEKYQNPVCSCSSKSIWLNDGKYIESEIQDESLSILIEDLFFKRPDMHNYYFTDTYDSVYYQQVVEPRQKIIKKLEKIKASKDL